MPRPVKLKSMRDFKKLQRRVKPVTLEELDKRLTKLEEKYHGLEKMIFRTRARLLTQ